MIPFKFIIKFPEILSNNSFSKYDDNDYVIIRNNNNNDRIQIPQNLFRIYCHFNDLIKLSEENIDVITVPFTFHSKAAKYFVNCLVKSKFILITENIEETDYEEFRQLMTYFQVTFT